MEKLFILGNGFDLAHGLKTEYKNFRNWIIKTYELKVSHLYDNEDDFSKLGIIKEFIDGKTEFQEDNLAELFLASIDYANEGNIKWKEFEESLSKLPYEFFDKICVFNTDKYVQPYKEANNAEIFGENLSRAFVYGIEKFFPDWIRSITVENKKRKKLICNNLDCTFLSFNYTSTLEDLYEVPDEQICHIHGYIKKDDDQKLIVGYGKESLDSNDNPFVASSYTYEAQTALKKPVDKILEKNKDFFQSLGLLKEIYIIGWNISNFDFVDKPYLEEIIKHTNEDTIIYFTSYDEDKGLSEKYKVTCKKLKFKGKFEICNLEIVEEISDENKTLNL